MPPDSDNGITNSINHSEFLMPSNPDFDICDKTSQSEQVSDNPIHVPCHRSPACTNGNHFKSRSDRYLKSCKSTVTEFPAEALPTTSTGGRTHTTCHPQRPCQTGAITSSPETVTHGDDKLNDLYVHATVHPTAVHTRTNSGQIASKASTISSTPGPIRPAVYIKRPIDGPQAPDDQSPPDRFFPAFTPSAVAEHSERILAFWPHPTPQAAQQFPDKDKKLQPP